MASAAESHLAVNYGAGDWVVGRQQPSDPLPWVVALGLLALLLLDRR